MMKPLASRSRSLAESDHAAGLVPLSSYLTTLPFGPRVGKGGAPLPLLPRVVPVQKRGQS